MFAQIKLPRIKFWGKINRGKKVKGRVEHKENKEEIFLDSSFWWTLLDFSVSATCSSEAMFSEVQLLKMTHCGTQRIS